MFYKEIVVTLVGHIVILEPLGLFCQLQALQQLYTDFPQPHDPTNKYIIYIYPINKSTSKLQLSPKKLSITRLIFPETPSIFLNWGTILQKVFSKFPVSHEIFHPFIPGCSHRCSRSCCAKNPLAAGRLALVNSCLRRKMM